MSENFKNKAVRDLAWALNSNAMLLGTHVVDQDVLDEEYLKYLPQLLKLDKNPSTLIDYLAKNNTRRLGHYFEQLVFFWLNQGLKSRTMRSRNPKSELPFLLKGGDWCRQVQARIGNDAVLTIVPGLKGGNVISTRRL